MDSFLDVIIPLPLPDVFTYRMPATGAEHIGVGHRVVVPFGRSKQYVGVVKAVHNVSPPFSHIKEPLEAPDLHPVVTPMQLRFWQWLADYYLCHLGEVCKAALPAGLLPSVELVVRASGAACPEVLPEKEAEVMHLLQQKGRLSVQAIGQAVQGIRPLQVVRSLLAMGLVEVDEQLRQAYVPKKETFVRLEQEWTSPLGRERVLQLLRNAPAQRALYEAYVKAAATGLADGEGWVSKRLLQEAAAASTAVWNSFMERQLMQVQEREVQPEGEEDAGAPAKMLTPGQAEAEAQINAQLQSKKVVLLHGVTASGKTEIYIRMIEKAIQNGQQVLYLLPEIALTTQITRRLKHIFGSRIAVYHSKYPDKVRAAIWQKQMSEHPYDVVLGVRSALFLPFNRLGLIIVDEEHEQTYKQADPAPRYHARDAAIMLAGLSGARVLLGSATPSIESYHNALTGKYGLVRLKQRFTNMPLPEVVAIDTAELKRKKRMTGLLAPPLLAKMKETIAEGLQVILFRNRRGYATSLGCQNCGWTPRCPRCDVSLTYHKQTDELHCHYCGLRQPLPTACPACAGTDLKQHGFGTERVDAEVQEAFPEAATVRLDLDSNLSTQAFEQVISDFEQHKADVMVGTQMVAKGLDFSGVTLVGVLHADALLNFPDFRAHERAFSLMLQVAGRAGRAERPGLVMLQTAQPTHPIIEKVARADYEGMAEDELQERELFGYPPFKRLLVVYIKHADESVADNMASRVAQALRKLNGLEVLGPDRPYIARQQGQHCRKIILKISKTISWVELHHRLAYFRTQASRSSAFGGCTLYYDVDPYRL